MSDVVFEKQKFAEWSAGLAENRLSVMGHTVSCGNIESRWPVHLKADPGRVPLQGHAAKCFCKAWLLAWSEKENRWEPAGLYLVCFEKGIAMILTCGIMSQKRQRT